MVRILILIYLFIAFFQIEGCQDLQVSTPFIVLGIKGSYTFHGIQIQGHPKLRGWTTPCLVSSEILLVSRLG